MISAALTPLNATPLPPTAGPAPAGDGSGFARLLDEAGERQRQAAGEVPAAAHPSAGPPLPAGPDRPTDEAPAAPPRTPGRQTSSGHAATATSRDRAARAPAAGATQDAAIDADTGAGPQGAGAATALAAGATDPAAPGAIPQPGAETTPAASTPPDASSPQPEWARAAAGAAPEALSSEPTTPHRHRDTPPAAAALPGPTDQGGAAAPAGMGSPAAAAPAALAEAAPDASAAPRSAGGDAAAAPTGFAAALAAAVPPLAPAAAAAPADGRLSAPPGTPAFATQFGAQVTTFVRNGLHHAVLELNPADMGPVTVQIQLDGATAQVHLSADQAATRQALAQAMPQLAGNLREAGLLLAGGGVFEQPRQMPSGGEGSGGDRQPDRGRRSDRGVRAAAGITDAPADRGPATSVRRRGVVDLLA